MNINHLDASALNANGGAFEGLSRVLASIVDRMAKSQDRKEQLQYEDARAGHQERRQDARDAEEVKRSDAARALTLALHGADPNDPEAVAKLAQQVATDHADATKRTKAADAQARAMGDMNLSKARMENIRAGNIEPQAPLLLEGQAAAEGAADRAATRSLAEERARAIRVKSLGGLMGLHGKSSGTGWHMDRDSGVWFRTGDDGSLIQFDPTTKKMTRFSQDGGASDATGTEDDPTTPATPEAPSRARTALELGMTGNGGATPFAGGPVTQPPIARSQPWTGTPPEAAQANKPDPAVDQARTSLADAQAMVQGLPKPQADQFLATQADLHNRWLQAAQAGDAAATARINQAIIKHKNALLAIKNPQQAP